MKSVVTCDLCFCAGRIIKIQKIVKLGFKDNDKRCGSIKNASKLWKLGWKIHTGPDLDGKE